MGEAERAQIEELIKKLEPAELRLIADRCTSEAQRREGTSPKPATWKEMKGIAKGQWTSDEDPQDWVTRTRKEAQIARDSALRDPSRQPDPS